MFPDGINKSSHACKIIAPLVVFVDAAEPIVADVQARQRSIDNYLPCEHNRATNAYLLATHVELYLLALLAAVRSQTGINQTAAYSHSL